LFLIIRVEQRQRCSMCMCIILDLIKILYKTQHIHDNITWRITHAWSMCVIYAFVCYFFNIPFITADGPSSVLFIFIAILNNEIISTTRYYSVIYIIIIIIIIIYMCSINVCEFVWYYSTSSLQFPSPSPTRQINAAPRWKLFFDGAFGISVSRFWQCIT